MTKKILIVEDDRDIREPMRELLEDEGYQVDCASTGKEALSMLQEQNPGVILCDLMMPHMGGVEMIEALRNSNKPEAVESVVILSAATGAEHTANELGVGFLKKPIDLEALLKTVQRYCA